MTYKFCGYYADEECKEEMSEREIMDKIEKMKNLEIALKLNELKNVDLQALITSKINLLNDELTLYCKCEPKEN